MIPDTDHTSGFRAIHAVDSLYASGGGPSRTVPELCKAVRGSGFPVQLFTTGVDNDLPAVQDLDVQAGSDPVRALDNAIRQFPTQTVIHNHGIWLPFNHAVCHWATRRSLPLVISPHGMLEPWRLQHHKWRKRIAWHAYQRRDLSAASCLRATSKMEAEQFRSLGMENPIAVIPNGVTLPEYSTLSHSDAPTDRHALFLSRLHPKKGLLDLVEAWRQVRPEHWTLLIAGPSEEDHEQVVRKAVKNAGLDECVQFLGSLDDREKWDVYAKSQLFVLPTLSENFGVVVAEALGAEVPVITTKAAPWSLLQEEDCGWWIETGVTPLVQALRHATGTPLEQLRTMGQRGRAAVLERFSWKRIGEQMAAAYYWLLGTGPEPDTLFEP